MALARSASGPGGLSISTSSANSLFSNTTTTSGGMFGSTQANKPLFGASAATTAPQSGGLFGSNAAASGTQTGGLFGSITTTSQPQTAGLFGPTTAASQPQTGGLFGSNTAASQPQTGGLFGSTTATSQPQSAGLFGSAQPGGGSLFGSTINPQPGASGALFGSSTMASQPQPSGGLFSGLGSQPAQNQNQTTGGGLFGASSTTQQGQGGGLFGGQSTQNHNKPATSLFSLGTNQTQQSQPQQSAMFSSLNQSQQPFGGGLMANSQQQQTVPGVRIDTTSIRGTTRFNELHDDLQTQIITMDTVIQTQIKLKNDCDAIMPSHNSQLSNIPSDVNFCNRKLKGLEDVIETDAESISVLRDLIKSDAEHAKLSFRAIDNLKLPAQYHNSGIWPPNSSSGDNRSSTTGGADAQDIVGLFSSTADELSAKLGKYQKNIAEIELHLRGVEASSAQQINALVAGRNGGAGGEGDVMRELTESLQEFERGILHVAGKVGSTREGVQSLQLGGFMGPTNGRDTNGKRSGVY